MAVKRNGDLTLEEIARLAGVSRSTVSRVVNGDARVSDAVRTRVRDIIKAENYHPNAAARSLASRRTRILGLLIPASVGSIFSDPFFAHLIQGAAEAGNAADHNLMLLLETSDDSAVADRLYRRVIRGRHLDGLVIASSLVDDSIVPQLQRDGFPAVLVGRHPHLDVNFVDVDNRAGARDAVNHFLGHGYRRIGMIGGPSNMIAAIDRAAGYAGALAEADLPVERRWVISGNFTQRGGYSAMQALLDHPP